MEVFFPDVLILCEGLIFPARVMTTLVELSTVFEV